MNTGLKDNSPSSLTFCFILPSVLSCLLCSAVSLKSWSGSDLELDQDLNLRPLIWCHLAWNPWSLSSVQLCLLHCSIHLSHHSHYLEFFLMWCILFVSPLHPILLMIGWFQGKNVGNCLTTWDGRKKSIHTTITIFYFTIFLLKNPLFFQIWMLHFSLFISQGGKKFPLFSSRDQTVFLQLASKVMSYLFAGKT